MTERNTKQKQMVYDALCALDHPTATEVYDEVHKTAPSVSRGTVFRLLGNFAGAGKIRRLQLSDSDMRYDMTVSPHFHVRCRVCGRVGDVFSDALVRALSEVKDNGAFELEGFDAEFFGICDQCKKAQEQDTLLK